MRGGRPQALQERRPRAAGRRSAPRCPSRRRPRCRRRPAARRRRSPRTRAPRRAGPGGSRVRARREGHPCFANPNHGARTSLRVRVSRILSRCLTIAALGDRNPEYLTHREIDATIALAPQIRWVGTEDARIDGYDGALDRAGNAVPRRGRRAGGDPPRARRGHADPRHLRRLPAHGRRVRAQRARDRRRRARRDRSRRRDDRRRRARLQPRRRGAHGHAGAGHAAGGDLRRASRSPASTTATTGSRPSCRASLVSAHADDAGVEAFELPDHPFYLATLFQPQVGTAERGALHPVLSALLAAVSGAAASRPA